MPIYLAVDDEELAAIGASRFDRDDAGSGGWDKDFCRAVRMKVVAGDQVRLWPVRGSNASGTPSCVGFLAAMVLAASRMAEDSDVSELNYFNRLREILSLEAVQGSNRPAGLGTGDEEPLWLEWNRWLTGQGFLPSARRGPDGPRKYINYPLSQALIRQADRQHLEDRFRKDRGRIPEHCDPQTLAAIVSEPRWPTFHLREVMAQDGLRRAAAEDAVFEAYESWKSSANGEPGSAVGGSRPLIAGLFREEDPIEGQVTYRVLPRMRRGRDAGIRPHLHQGDDGGYRLRPLRAGWYEPAGPVSPSDLTNGTLYKLTGLNGIEAVELPQRPFWMFVPEPEDPESGLFASWGPPRLGEPFILLAQDSLMKDLTLLREEGLVEWQGEPRGTTNGWFELHDFLAVSEAWDGVHTENVQLFLELRPRGVLSISISGGLRSPSGAWLEGYGPSIVVHGFEGSGSVVIAQAGEDSQRQELAFLVNQPVEGIVWSRKGDFVVQAETGDERSEDRLVRIESWDDLRLRTPEAVEQQAYGDMLVSGAVVSRRETVE